MGKNVMPAMYLFKLPLIFAYTWDFLKLFICLCSVLYAVLLYEHFIINVYFR